MINYSSNTLLPFLRDSTGVQTLFAACGIKLDISRQRFSGEDLKALCRYARSRGLEREFGRMVSGEIVNVSENRAALHTALRAFAPSAPHFKNVDRERRRVLSFARQVREGRWRGCRGDRITSVINIGIGGSEIGPHAVWHALRAPQPDIRLHFLSSVDGVLLERILAQCNPKSTLIVVSSKSFTTRETQVNAAAVDQWLLDNGIVGADRTRHLVVVSANPQAAETMCLPPENFFHIWNWVGGRFSVWGAIGLPLAIALGPDAFLEFLQGASEMDRHASSAPLEENLPALLAMIDFWNATRLEISSHCLLPYDERLRRMVPWLQQLEMESLGKNHSPTGERILGHTGLGVWGANGDEAQHSFYQWLREGTGRTSIDIVWSEMPGHRYATHYRVLLANARAQAETLIMREADSPYFNAVSAIVLDAITPRRLGAFMAMYEHKTTMLGTLFGINPFDQPGVELGKRLSKRAESGADVRSVLEEEARNL